MTLIDFYLNCAWTKTKANVTPYIKNTFYKYFGSKHVNAGPSEPEGGGNSSSDFGRNRSKTLKALDYFLPQPAPVGPASPPLGFLDISTALKREKLF